MSDIPSLDVQEFSEVFEAVHGVHPYAWQLRLLQQIVDGEGAWPRAIAAPTGAGKTAVLDIALFHLALSVDAPRRSAPLRIVLAVDRRIIVDQAFQRARRLRDALAVALRGNGKDALGRAARRLASYSDGNPLHVAELRGGMPLEHEWARRPDQPTILCTTVDQLGSRLLFRGYGVSAGMAPVHAGLLGVDALLVLDEAHLSTAFKDTLRAVATFREPEERLELPWMVTTLTATPREDDAAVFRLTDAEREEDTIRKRLSARKPVELVLTPGDPSADVFARYARRLAEQLRAEGEPAPVVAVVVNRVALARAVFAELSEADTADAVLLTGRVRPAARDVLLQAWQHRLEGGCDGNAAVAPLYVVATQCIEAGADFDFDAMVSQIASLDALRQRFGRLARRGNREYGPAPGVIVAAKSEISKKASDPVYGRGAAETWAWLQGQASDVRRGTLGRVGFGPDELDALISRQPPPPECSSPSPAAPILRRADLETAARTSPRPFPDLETSLFLHGEVRDDAEVSVIWRADLDDLFAGALAGDDAAVESMGTVLTHLPPRPAEALRLPLWAVRRWLRQTPGTGAAEVGDVPTTPPEEGEERGTAARWVLRWRGPGEVALAAPEQIAPGDTVVVPAGYGGCDAFGWAPRSDAPVEDIADVAAVPYSRRRAALRLHRAVWRGEGGVPPWTEVAAMLDAGASVRELADACGLEAWAKAPRLSLAFPYGEREGAGALLVAPSGLPDRGGRDESAVEPVTEADLGSAGARPVSLASHLEHVTRVARSFAAALALPEGLRATLAAAAQWHDAGKADPRFQEWLRLLGGLPPQEEELAKSGRTAGPGERSAARIQAMLPPRWRHEVQSVRIAAQAAAHRERGEGDLDLMIWLIGTHHGHGRPFFRHDDEWDQHAQELLGLEIPPAPGPDKLDFAWRGWDWTGLMETLQGRYGFWGLAYLEACLRLADHRASEEEEQ